MLIGTQSTGTYGSGLAAAPHPPRAACCGPGIVRLFKLQISEAGMSWLFGGLADFKIEAFQRKEHSVARFLIRKEDQRWQLQLVPQ